MHYSEDVWQVLRHFPIAAGSCQAVDSDGFSGAKLWRVADGERQYCLRRWPEGTNSVRVKSINTVLAQSDLPFIPRPVIANSLDGVVTHAGYPWTLQPWMPGKCIAKLPPSRDLLCNALQALALFHQMTARFAVADDCLSEDGYWVEGSQGRWIHLDFPDRNWNEPPPGLKSRIALTSAYLKNSLVAIRIARIPGDLEELQFRRERSVPLFLEVAPRVLDQSQHALQMRVPLQPCIRDIHAGHVLFTGDQVTGLIDFDAMRVDSVATDLARLLGSYCGDDFELWDIGLAAYDEIRPLNKDERDLVVHYDRLAVLLTGLQWLDWMLLEGKQFELARVLPRIDATLERLEHLRDNLRIGTGPLFY